MGCACLQRPFSARLLIGQAWEGTCAGTCQAGLLWAVYVGACLRPRAIVSVTVLSTRSHPNLPACAKQNPHATCCRCIARHTRRASSLPEGCCPWLQLGAHPLPSRLVASLKRYYTPSGTESTSRLSYSSSGPCCCGGRRLSQRHGRGCTLARPLLPTDGGTQCDPYMRSTRQIKSIKSTLLVSRKHTQFKDFFGACPSSTSLGPTQHRPRRAPP